MKNEFKLNISWWNTGRCPPLRKIKPKVFKPQLIQDIEQLLSKSDILILGEFSKDYETEYYLKNSSIAKYFEQMDLNDESEGKLTFRIFCRSVSGKGRFNQKGFSESKSVLASLRG